ADAGAQLAADALLHAVLVAIEDVAPVEAVGLGPDLVGILRGDDVVHLAQRHLEAVEETHQPAPLTSMALVRPMRMARSNRPQKTRPMAAATGTHFHSRKMRAPRIRSQASDSGISRFQPRSMSWS